MSRVTTIAFTAVAAWLLFGGESLAVPWQSAIPRSELSIQYRQIRGVTRAWTTLIINHKAVDAMVVERARSPGLGLR
jgi:hypothetical protein